MAIVTFVLFLIFLEYVALKYFIPTTDVARVEHDDGITHYKALQKGTIRLANEYSALFSINEDGWNSHHDKYFQERNNKTRIAVIGDSYIAALEPGYLKAIPNLLEQRLGPDHFEVYGFGIGAAHLAQYLHIFRNEVLKYDPDIAVFLIIHNDFAPSYRKDLMASGRYGGTFLTLSLSGNRIKEIPPKPYDPSWDSLLDIRLLRFMFYQYKLRTKINYIKSLVLNEQYQMNMSVKDLEGSFDNDLLIADYVVKNIASFAKEKNIKLIFAMNGDTWSIYNQDTSNKPNNTLKFNVAMRQIVEKHGGRFIDLHKNFLRDYQENHERFEFKTDGHWNPYGHQVATKPIYKAIQELIQ
ncbi:MAG: SGNH/GDSL hydrolase family protein [Nitrospinae bacterium]|nr:SGNH/GDSL hydrolase family protein [Nitrospinota bacterium]